MAWRGATAAAVIFVAVIILTVVLTRVPLLGYRAVIISGGSMEPAIDTGSLLLSEATPADDLGAGDVITFRAPGSPTTITHRIVSVREEEGTKWFTVKGDANQTPDADEVSFATSSAYRMQGGVPYAGYALSFMGGGLGRLLLVVVPLGALGLIQLKTVWDRLRAKRAGRAPEAPFVAANGVPDAALVAQALHVDEERPLPELPLEPVLEQAGAGPAVYAELREPVQPDTVGMPLTVPDMFLATSPGLASQDVVADESEPSRQPIAAGIPEPAAGGQFDETVMQAYFEQAAPTTAITEAPQTTSGLVARPSQPFLQDPPGDLRESVMQPAGVDSFELAMEPPPEPVSPDVPHYLQNIAPGASQGILGNPEQEPLPRSIVDRIPERTFEPVHDPVRESAPTTQREFVPVPRSRAVAVRRQKDARPAVKGWQVALLAALPVVVVGLGLLLNGGDVGKRRGPARKHGRS